MGFRCHTKKERGGGEREKECVRERESESEEERERERERPSASPSLSVASGQDLLGVSLPPGGKARLLKGESL